MREHYFNILHQCLCMIMFCIGVICDNFCRLQLLYLLGTWSIISEQLSPECRLSKSFIWKTVAVVQVDFYTLTLHWTCQLTRLNTDVLIVIPN